MSGCICGVFMGTKNSQVVRVCEILRSQEDVDVVNVMRRFHSILIA